MPQNKPLTARLLRECIADILPAIRKIVSDELQHAKPPPKQYLTLPEAAEHLGLSRQRLYDLVHERSIPHIKNGRLYFDTDELNKWMALKHRVTIKQLQPL